MPSPAQQACAVNRPAGRQSRERTPARAGGRVFDPYDAGRHSQRTRQQRRRLCARAGTSAAAPGLRLPTRSVVRPPGRTQRGTRVSLRLACLGRGHGPAGHFSFQLDASWTRTCVALVLAVAAPVRRRARTPDPALSHWHARPPAAVNADHFSTRCRRPPEDRLPPATAGLPAIPLPPRPGRERPTVRNKACADGSKAPISPTRGGLEFGASVVEARTDKPDLSRSPRQPERPTAHPNGCERGSPKVVGRNDTGYWIRPSCDGTSFG